MSKIESFLKFIFYSSTVFLVILSLFPGSLLGLLFYGDLGRQPDLIKNPLDFKKETAAIDLCPLPQ